MYQERVCMYLKECPPITALSELNARGRSGPFGAVRGQGATHLFHLVSDFAVDFHWPSSTVVVTRARQQFRFGSLRCRASAGKRIQVRGFRILRDDLSSERLPNGIHYCRTPSLNSNNYAYCSMLTPEGVRRTRWRIYSGSRSLPCSTPDM